MKRVIEYRYNSWTEDCGCCHYSSSTYDMWEDGKLVVDDGWCELTENEEELRVNLSHLEPFEVSPDSNWF